MFNYKCNGSLGPSDVEAKPNLDDRINVKVKIENEHNSIIGLEERLTKGPVRQRLKRCSVRATHHETLQRIEQEDVYNYYQQHWFSPSLEKLKLEDRSREERIEITRHEFHRYIQQLIRSNVGQPNRFPKVKPVKQSLKSHNNGYDKLVSQSKCEVDQCSNTALPCARHCTLHIMWNHDQVLFDYCTAKFADNTQCSVPVFDIMHELPLCPEHARKRDNYKMYQEGKPKKLRKKGKPSAMIRPQKRNKKKKKCPTNSILEVPLDNEEVGEESEELVEIDQVLGEGLDPNLVNQAHLLEETDISNVLSTIQVDEFSDFFAVNRNGEYEPSREEAEELEKALAAVDNDVKSLEKLSQSQGLLDSLLDEHISETLVPEIYHNGYAPCGDSMVAQTSSFLLPVEHTNS